MELWSHVTDHPIAAAGIGLVVAVGLAWPALRRSSKPSAIAVQLGTDRTEIAASSLAVHEQLIQTLARPGKSITNGTVADVRSRLNGFKASFGSPVKQYTDESELLIRDMVASYINSRNARRRWAGVTSAFINLYRGTGAPDADQVAQWASSQSIEGPGSVAPTALKTQARGAPMMRRKR